MVQKVFHGVPDIVVKILRASGFDSKAALTILNHESLVDIEEYVEENRALVFNSIYSDKHPFKFFPGHKAIVLDMPRRLEQCAVSSTSSSTEMRKKPLTSAEIDQEIDLLLKKLQNYIDTLHLSIQLTRSDIHDFVQASDRYKCRFTCQLCGTVISCFKANYWIAVNVLAHFKRHKGNYEIEADDGQNGGEQAEMDECVEGDEDEIELGEVYNDDDDDDDDDNEDCLTKIE